MQTSVVSLAYWVFVNWTPRLTIRHTHTHTHACGRTSQNELAAGIRGRYLRKTQQAQGTNIHEFSGTWTRDYSKPVATGLRLKRPLIIFYSYIASKPYSLFSFRWQNKLSIHIQLGSYPVPVAEFALWYESTDLWILAFILISVYASTCSRMQLHIFWNITSCRLVNN
jgi:hypothetical protein